VTGRFMTLPMVGVAFLFAALAAPAQAADVPIVTGEHWTKASEAEKKAFLVGAANVISIEYELRRDDLRQRPGMIAALVSNLQPMTLSDISQAVDAYYMANPGQTSRSVIEVIVTDIARSNRRSRESSYAEDPITCDALRRADRHCLHQHDP